MSSVSETVLVRQKSKTIGKTGNTAAIYIPREIKEYVDEGDKITFDAVINGNVLELVICKQLYNFDVADVRKISDKYEFKTEYDKTIGDVTILEATKGDMTLSYAQNRGGHVRPANVIVSKKLTDVNHDVYDGVWSWATRLQEKFDVIVRTEGDIDVINMLKEPKRYKITREKAFNLLKESGKTVGVSITCRFDSKNNTTEEIKKSLDELSEPNPQLFSGPQRL